MVLEIGASPSPSPIFGGFADIVASLEPTPLPGINATLRLYQQVASSSSSSSSSYLLPALIVGTVFLGGIIYHRTYRPRWVYQELPQVEL